MSEIRNATNSDWSADGLYIALLSNNFASLEAQGFDLRLFDDFARPELSDLPIDVGVSRWGRSHVVPVKMSNKSSAEDLLCSHRLHTVVSSPIAIDLCSCTMDQTIAESLSQLARDALSKGLSREHFFQLVQQQCEPVFSSPSSSGAPRKKIRAYIDGCFDCTHSGHFNAIRQARAICDELVVGVHTCEEIARQKGPPVMSDDERKSTVESCRWVSEVAFGTPYTPTLALLDSLNCDFCVHGDDMAVNADGVDAYAEIKAANRMRIVKRTEGVSTTDLVGRLLAVTKSESPASPAISPSPASTSMSAFLPTSRRISQFSPMRAPQPTDKVIYIDGTFDMFHSGHIAMLEKARALGTFLYVGVLEHGRDGKSTVMGLHERALNVLSCKYVDEVVIGAPSSITKDLLTSLNISVVADCSFSEASLASLDPHALAKSINIHVTLEEPRFVGVLASSLCLSHSSQTILAQQSAHDIGTHPSNHRQSPAIRRSQQETWRQRDHLSEPREAVCR